MMRTVGVVLLGLMVGCTAADDGDWVVRPPGNGTGGGGGTVDAGVADADGDGGTGLVGHVCVVTAMENPRACATGAVQSGVAVRRVGDPSGTTTDADGRFTLAVAGSIVVLEVARGAASLQPSVVPVSNDGTEVVAPVPTVAEWTATLQAAATTVTPGNGSIALYVDTAVGAAAMGVRFDLPASGIAGPFYDDGTGWTAGVGTGTRGAVLFTDLADGTYTLEGRDADNNTISIVGVPVVPDRVTFVRRRLP